MLARAFALALCLSSLPAAAFAGLPLSHSRRFPATSPRGFPTRASQDFPTIVSLKRRSGKYAAFAMDFSEEDGFYENFNAVLPTRERSASNEVS